MSEVDGWLQSFAEHWTGEVMSSSVRNNRGKKMQTAETMELDRDKDIVTRNLTKELDMPLSEADIAELGRKAADIEKQISLIEVEFDAVKKQFKTRIEAHASDMRKMLSDIRDGKVARMVECTEVRNYTDQLITHKVDGKVIEERAMQGDEFQKDLFIRQTDPNLQNADDIEIVEALPQIHDVISSLHNPGQDLKDVMREETSVRTKHSSVDGPMGLEA